MRRRTRIRVLHRFIGGACLVFLGCQTASAQGLLPARVFNEGNSQYETGLFDVGRTFLQFEQDAGRTSCVQVGSGRAQRVGNEFRVSATYVDQVASVPCLPERVFFGELQAGAYSIVTTLARADGSGLQRSTAEFVVERRALVCGLTPTVPLLELGYRGPNVASFVERYNSDPALRHSLGDIVLRSWQGASIISADYPPLADTQRVLAALRGSGLFNVVSSPWVPWRCSGYCRPDETRPAIEYYHPALDRYFFTDEPAEIAKLDSGGTAGWTRTGEAWKVVSTPGGDAPVAGEFQMVFRFWSADAGGAFSHFFTVDRGECAQLRDGQKTGWVFEGAPFWAHLPDGGTCKSGKPLYRMYNNAKGGAPSHRFVIRPDVIESMQAQGWTNEGLAMCVAD